MIRSKAASLALIGILVCGFNLFAGEIHRAVEEGDAARVAALLKQDPALVIQQDDNDMRDHPLHTAALGGHVEIAGMLLDAGAQIDAGDMDNSTPLDDAAVRQHVEVVRLLIDRGANLDSYDNRGACPISFAMSTGNSEIINMLLAAGARLHFPSTEGTTLLHYAASRNMTEFVPRLIANGDDVNAARGNGATPLHWTAYAAGTDVATMLIDRGANVSAADTTGETVLHYAVMRRNLDLARLLLDRGADVNAESNNGWTAIMWAARHDEIHYATLLVAHGADVNRVSQSGRTPLFTAVEEGNLEMVDALLKGGARVDIREPNEGRTVLHYAALQGFTDIVERLLNRGAYLEGRDNHEMTAFAYAAQYGHGSAARLLRERGALGSGARMTAPADLASTPVPPLGEADVWFLGHSGWAVRTANHFLVFDWFEGGRRADIPGLCNGNIETAELRDENVTVFASHEHADHYDPQIFDWKGPIRDVNYVLGCEPEDVPPYEYIGPRQTRTVDGMKVTTIESNDSGVGFVIEVDGLVLFHAGDHANRLRDFSGPYQAEIDYLAGRGVQPDIAFMPVSGCGFGDQEAVAMGVRYALEALRPIAFFPMHAGANCYRLRGFIAENEDGYPGTRMESPGNRGDRIHYSRKKAS